MLLYARIGLFLPQFWSEFYSIFGAILIPMGVSITPNTLIDKNILKKLEILFHIFFTSCMGRVCQHGGFFLAQMNTLIVFFLFCRFVSLTAHAV